MSATLDIRDLAFGYEREPVLRQVSLYVRPGEMTALLGANGGGKTTLLRLAAGTLSPWSGQVLLNGRPAHGYPRRELARLVAVLPQEVHVPAGWKVEEIVALGRTPHIGLFGGPRERDREAVAAALRATESDHVANARFESLSEGQKQLVALAMVLAQEPRLLLLDEPTAHLDVRHRASLLDTITELRERYGLTVLAAMHDPTLAALYFERIVLLAHGRVLADGGPGEVLTEGLLEEAYGAPVRVTRDPELGTPMVTVLPARLRDRGYAGPR